jgi:demethylmenaquinone methyltransferase/2-methoxy-6-polyprenyl-1,4-benzoquinol methylase
MHKKQSKKYIRTNHNLTLKNQTQRNYYLKNAYNKKMYNFQLFTIVAPKYNLATRLLSFGRDGAWKKQLLNMIPAFSKLVCLDLACGTGDIALKIALKMPDAKVIGLDLNHEMLEKARQIKSARYSHLDKLHFVQGDICKLPFDDSSFHTVTGGYALRNAPVLEKALQEIYRVLKPGGRALFLDFAKQDSKFSQFVHISLLKLWGSIWGFVLHKNQAVYAYIAESLRVYPCNSDLINLLKKTGFKKIMIKPLFFGFTQLISFKK